jgi:hypothetical protein
MRDASGTGNIAHRMTAMPIRQAVQHFAAIRRKFFES